MGRYSVFRDGSRVTDLASPDQDTSYTSEGLLSGTSYTFTVAAVASVTGSDGTTTLKEGASSQGVVGTTSGPPPPLSAPTGLSVASTTADSVTLTWDYPQSGASSFNVFRDGQNVATGVAMPPFTDGNDGLVELTAYTYAITASASTGEESGSSASVVATTASGWQCTDYYANNYDHVQAGRATTTGGNCYCVGSNDNLGLYNVATYTTVAETSSGYYEKASCP
jgi:hypothetical protein